MSKATEIAEREAAAAEAENPDAEPVDPIEPDESEQEAEADAEEAPAEPSSLAVIQGMEKALEAEAKRHEKAVAKALGEHFGDFVECPLCQVAGYAMMYQPGEIGPDQRDEILTVMGETSGRRLKKHPDLETCDFCDGEGELETGSKRPDNLTEVCPKCAASGYVHKSTPHGNVAQFPSREPYPWENETQPVVAPNVDRWGRPSNHPDFGLDPAGIVATVQAS